MENESKIMLDENAGIMIDDGKINAVAFLLMHSTRNLPNVQIY